jgi:hypothetical protein
MQMALTTASFAWYANGMASPGELVAVMADTLGVPTATVAQYDRVLAENGLRSSGGRGLSAAKVTPVDAANLLLAIMGSPISGAAIKEAAKTCKSYGGLRSVLRGLRQKGRLHAFKRVANLPAGHSLREALVALIEDADAVANAVVVIQLDSPSPGGQINIGRGEKFAILGYGSLNKRRDEVAGVTQKDLLQSRFVTIDTVKRLAAIVRSR